MDAVCAKPAEDRLHGGPLVGEHLGRFDLQVAKRFRPIWLNDRAYEIVKHLCEQWPEGPIFRNGSGQPWTRNAIRCRFRYLKRKMNLPGLCGTVMRHSFAHHRLTSGQDALTVAKLMGHADGRMLATRYGYLDKATEYMLKEANRFSGGQEKA